MHSHDLTNRLRRGLTAACLVTLAILLLGQSAAFANTDNTPWPEIDGMLLMNKLDGNRPLDARPGHDPFGGSDSSYSCDAVHRHGGCDLMIVTCTSISGCPQSGHWVHPERGRKVHNELLGGHGSDTIHAGPKGDVLWGDYKPSGQGTKQHDRLTGGAGNDFIYASHGVNLIHAGAGNDFIKAHFTRPGSVVDCGPGKDVLYIPIKVRRSVRISNCERISSQTLGY